MESSFSPYSPSTSNTLLNPLDSPNENLQVVFPQIPNHLTIQQLQSLPLSQQFQLQNLEYQLLMLSTTSVSSLMKSLLFPSQVRQNLKGNIKECLQDIHKELSECSHILKKTENAAWKSNVNWKSNDNWKLNDNWKSNDSELKDENAASKVDSIKMVDEKRHFQSNATLSSKDRLLLFQLFDQKNNIESILEIPSLMISCLNQDLYSEVWDLHQYLETLTENYGDKIPILKDLSQQSIQIMSKLISKIFHQLCLPKITIPQCLRFVTILRQLNLCSENDLKIIFLQNRLKHLRELQLDSFTRFISSSQVQPVQMDKYPNFKKELPDTLSQTSSHVYDFLLESTQSLKAYLLPVITQYKALFQKGSNLEDEMILSSCIHYHVTLPYTNTIKGYLLYIQESEKLARIAEEIQFTCQSLAKIGIDIRQILDLYFTLQMENILNKFFTQPIIEFRQNLQSYSWDISDTSMTVVSNQQQKQLLLYRPIALLTNSLLTALNELKNFPILQLKYYSLNQIVKAIQSSINISIEMKDNNSISIKEKNFSEFMNIFRKELPEFIFECFKNIYQVNSEEKEKFLSNFVL